jgi:hypothetical protein
MPYIKQEARDRLTGLNGAAPGSPMNAGELNYAMTMLVLSYVRRIGEGGYAQINDVLGAFEGAKLEFYRRYAAPYEDVKRAQNGDVY